MLGFNSTFLWISWIPFGIPMKYLRIWSNISASNNSLKMGFIAVEVTEVSSLTIAKSRSKTTKIRTAKFCNYQKDSASPMNRDLP